MYSRMRLALIGGAKTAINNLNFLRRYGFEVELTTRSVLEVREEGEIVGTVRHNSKTPAQDLEPTREYMQKRASETKDSVMADWLVTIQDDPQREPAKYRWFGNAMWRMLLDRLPLEGLKPRLVVERDWSSFSTVLIWGDHHCDVWSLMQHLNQNDIWEGSSWRLKRGVGLVFTGDYGDRGFLGLEVNFIIWTAWANNPDQVVVLAGNHEDPNTYSVHGRDFDETMRAQLRKQGGLEPELDATALKEDVQRVHSVLPCAVLFKWRNNKRVQCNHGGFPFGRNNEKKRSPVVLEAGVVSEKVQHALLWGDFAVGDYLIARGQRGPNSQQVGTRGCAAYMKANKLDLSVSGHQHFFPARSALQGTRLDADRQLYLVGKKLKWSDGPLHVVTSAASYLIEDRTRNPTAAYVRLREDDFIEIVTTTRR